MNLSRLCSFALLYLLGIFDRFTLSLFPESVLFLLLVM